MPLSEHEQKVLDQLEAQLAADPGFARQWERPASQRFRGRPALGRMLLGLLLALVGLGAVLAGVALHLVPLGVAGFVLMGTGVLVAMSASARQHPGPGPSEKKPSRMMARLEARWEQRREQRGRP